MVNWKRIRTKSSSVSSSGSEISEAGRFEPTAEDEDEEDDDEEEEEEDDKAALDSRISLSRAIRACHKSGTRVGGTISI